MADMETFRTLARAGSFLKQGELTALAVGAEGLDAVTDTAQAIWKQAGYALRHGDESPPTYLARALAALREVSKAADDAPEDAAFWLADLAAVEGYRQLAGITDENVVLGQRPDDPDLAALWDDTMGNFDRLGYRADRVRADIRAELTLPAARDSRAPAFAVAELP